MNTNKNKVISVFSRGSAKRLYFEFFDNKGKKRQKSTKLKNTKANKAKAWKLASAFEKKLEEKAKEEENSRLQQMKRTLEYYARKYLISLEANGHTKLIANTGRVKRILKYFGEKTLPADITDLEIEEFFEHLNVSRDTKSDWKVVLTAIFEKARKDRAIPTNIVKRFTLPSNEMQRTSKSIRMPYNIEEIHKLIENADRRLRNYLGIAFNLGLRPEEVLGLMEKDIDFSHETLHLRRVIVSSIVKPITEKKGGERNIPLFANALPFINDQLAWAKEKNSQYLFFDKDGHRLNDSIDIRGEPGGDFYWNDYLKELNIYPNRRMMNTRHTFAIYCIRNMEKLNIDLNDIALIMGHSSLRMLILHYGKYLKNENKKIRRDVSIFCDER